MKNIPVFGVGNVVELKKAHPCGCSLFTILRVGSDIKIVCNECKRTLILERIKFEKMIKSVKNGEIDG